MGALLLPVGLAVRPLRETKMKPVGRQDISGLTILVSWGEREASRLLIRVLGIKIGFLRRKRTGKELFAGKPRESCGRPTAPVMVSFDGLSPRI